MIESYNKDSVQSRNLYKFINCKIYTSFNNENDGMLIKNVREAGVASIASATETQTAVTAERICKPPKNNRRSIDENFQQNET